MENIKLLIVVANPLSTSRLRFDKEVRDIEEIIERSPYRSSIELVTSLATTPYNLKRKLLQFKPNIIHFSGHSDNDGNILLDDDTNTHINISSDVFVNTIKLFSDDLKLVVLNSCYSDSIAVQVAEHVPHTIGMNSSISDKAAINFSKGFYEGLSYGKSISDSFNLGKNSIALSGGSENYTPVYYISQASKFLASGTAFFQAASEWEKTKDQKKSIEVYNKTYSNELENKETLNQSILIDESLDDEAFKVIYSNANECWNEFISIMQDPLYLPKEKDNATKATKACTCRELQRVYYLAGCIPCEKMNKWWNKYKCLDTYALND